MKDKHLHIIDPSQFSALKHLGTRYHAISIQLPYLDPQKNEALTREINQEYFECGCKTGSYFTFASLIVVLPVIGTLWISNRFFPTSEALYGLGCVAFLSLIGKITGILSARYRLLKSLRVI